MDFIFGLIGELWFVILVVAAMAAWEHWSYLNNQRVMMWAAGVLGITFLIWFKGAGYMWSWLLGVGWFAVLVYADRRLHGETEAAKAETDGPRDSGQDGASARKRFGTRRY
jgi:hypothetical protein